MNNRKSLLITFFLICLFLPIFELFAQDNTAKVYIFRNQSKLETLALALGHKPELAINDVEVGSLSNKKYIECVIPSGEISVSLFYPDAKDSQQRIDFVAESGEKYYIKVSVRTKGGNIGFNLNGTNNSMIKSGDTDYSLKIARIMASEGEKLLKKCKEELVADITDLVTPRGMYYANTTGSTNSVNHSLQHYEVTSSQSTTLSDVDKNIPLAKEENKNTYVLIFANENYAFLDDVEYALKDGRIFKEYCIKTLGIPERQVWLYENASLGIMSSGINKLVQASEIFDTANAIVYYCGHGIPDEKTGEAYIIPVDGNGTDVTSCLSINKLYKTLSDTKADKITYFMDACFTGTGKDGSMLVAARGVAREPKKDVIEGNSIVFSAASGDETALPFREKGHGLFTYFLLKKLQDSNGNVSYGELAEYISENVKRESFMTNGKLQNPVVMTSKDAANNWSKIKLK